MILGLWCTIPTTTNLSYSSNSNLLALKKKERKTIFCQHATFCFSSFSFPSTQPQHEQGTLSMQVTSNIQITVFSSFRPWLLKTLCVGCSWNIYVFFCGRWILKTLKSNKKHKSCLRLSNFHCLYFDMYFVLCSGQNPLLSCLSAP